MDRNLINKFKARGKDEDGVMHTGWLSAYFVNGKLKTYIQEEQIDGKPAMTYFVLPESVETLVCEVNGKEIFENEFDKYLGKYYGEMVNKFKDSLSKHSPA